MATQLTDKLTPLSADEAAQALAEGYFHVVGKKPSVKVLNLLVAQSALETGNWQTGIHNFNFGNEKYIPSKDEFFQVYSFRDDPTDPGAAYAAFLDSVSGAEHYVRTLLHRDHWAAGLKSGNLNKFVTALSTAPVYFTADPTRYANTLSKLVSTYKPLAKKYGTSFLKNVTTLAVATGIVLGGIKAVRIMRT